MQWGFLKFDDIQTNQTSHLYAISSQTLSKFQRIAKIGLIAEIRTLSRVVIAYGYHFAVGGKTTKTYAVSTEAFWGGEFSVIFELSR